MVSTLVGNCARTSTKPDSRTRRFRGAGLIAGTLVSFLLAGVAQATTYYVAQTGGSDSNAGTSVTAPWATIGKANATLRAGDTVYIRGGTYYETVTPSQSGVAGAPITYKNYGSETVVLTGIATGINLTSRSYVVVDGISCQHPIYGWVIFNKSYYCTVANGTFSTPGTTYSQVALSGGSAYNQLRNNSFDQYNWNRTAYNGQIQQDSVTLWGSSTHNLIEGNNFKYASHCSVAVQAGCDYNVIRNNQFDNPWHHNLVVYDAAPGPQFCLVENNTFRDAGTDHVDCPYPGDAAKPVVFHAGLQWGPGPNGIVRQNVFYNNGSGLAMGSGYFDIIDSKIYHNTFYKNYINIGANTTLSVNNYAFLNNILYEHQVDQESTTTYDYDIYFYATGNSLAKNVWQDNTVAYHTATGVLSSRIWYGYSSPPVVGNLSTIQSAFPADWSSNYQVDPQFVDAANLNVNLQSTSPAIDRARYLTLTTNAGATSRTVTVQDAEYFFSGPGAPWNIPGTTADEIYIAGSGAATIASIDSGTNTITLTSPMTWASGAKVYHRPYVGTAPDIGAYEYQGSSATYTLTVSATNGTVTKTPNQTTYTSGQTVTLQATPNTGYTFSGWSGDLTGTTNPATLTMNSNKSVTANFTAVAPTTYTLTVSATNGTVTKTPNQTTYTSGQTVTLQATPNAGYTFSGWSGDLTGTTNPATLTMNGNKSVTADFTALTYTLTVSATNGTVTKTPNQTTYTYGQTVTLQATPNTGYTFSGWSGDLTGTTNPATLTMNANKAVTANFTAIQPTTYTLTVSATNGAVTETPNQATYTSGQTVTLQATPNTGYTFTGWSGALTGTTNPATLTMTANESVTANFTAATYTLTVSATNGTVTKTPNQATYTSGQTVILQATPNTGYTFSGWSGDLTGTTNPATLVMNSNKSVTASFTNSASATYYVDLGAGKDTNDGKSPTTAWRTIAKVNSYTGFKPGDQILLQRGNVWREQLVVPASGVAGNPITFGAYGTGNRPLLKGSKWFSTWTNAGTNLWKVLSSTRPDQVFFNGVRGTVQTSLAALKAARQWYWASGVLYVYATSRPSGTAVEASFLPATRDSSGLIQVQDRSYVTVQSIEVSQSYAAGIHIGPTGQGITITDCEADNSNDGGIVAFSPTVALSNVTVKNCLAHQNNGAIQDTALRGVTYREGVTMEGVKGFAVQGCQIYNNYSQGVGLEHGATNGIFENCQVYANGQLNIYVDGATGTQIRYNKIYNCTADAGIKFGLEMSAYNNDTVQVYYNLLWNNAKGIAFTANNGVTSQTRNINLYDNTFYNNGIAVHWTAAATGHYSGANNIKNDLLWPLSTTNVEIRDQTTGKQGIAQTVIAYNAFLKNAPTDTLGTSARVITNPYFASPSTYDFHLMSGSPCIDTGTYVGLTRDFDGKLVPQGSGVDIGAYEYGTLMAATTSATTLAAASVASAPTANNGTTGTPTTAKGSSTQNSTLGSPNASLGGTVTVGTPTSAAPASGSAGVAPTTGTRPTVKAGDSTPDQLPPAVGDCTPAPDAIQSAPDTLVVLHVRDAGEGVDAASVAIRVDGNLVYSGGVNAQRTLYGLCSRSGTKADYTYTYQPLRSFGYGRDVTVAVRAQDLAGNVMPEQMYSFTTEMYSFGASRNLGQDQKSLPQGRPATVRDRLGNLWVVWQAGDPGSRQIYAGRLRPDGATYSPTVQLSLSAGDHCNPALAIDGAGLLYAVWQENAGGTWDVCVSTSVDGRAWSAPKPLVPPTTTLPRPVVNRTNPVVAASRQRGGLVAAAWQEDQAGNQDIYVAGSANRFQTVTVARVTSDPAAQTDPAIAISGLDTIVVLWSDARNGATDIYGATSDNGPWTNVPVVNGASSQSHPAVAAASTGRTLHLAWVDDQAGNLDVFYATSDGLPASPLTGASIVDDTSGADQQAPVLAVAATRAGTDRVFVCWEDARNIASGGTTDLYFAEVGPGALRTNVPVDTAGTSGAQHEPALGTDRWGYPYVVWTGEASATRQLYYAGATYVSPVPLARARIIAAVGGLVGKAPQRIRTLDDVSLALPAGACPCNATISAARICHPRLPATESPSQVQFGPSDLLLGAPATVTIPYPWAGAGTLHAYWFDAVTGSFRDEGLTDVRSLHVTQELGALQFKTTRLAPFYLIYDGSVVISGLASVSPGAAPAEPGAGTLR